MPGELTHIDLWGKYSIVSINRHQYYIVFVDDAGQYMTVDFLKGKDEASQKVKEYLTYLKTQGRYLRAIHVDGGKEFINQNLCNWCCEQGIEIQITAPYSPSQNGVAEHMNCTLIEPSQAMLTAHHLPEFL